MPFILTEVNTLTQNFSRHGYRGRTGVSFDAIEQAMDKIDLSKLAAAK